MYKNGEKIKYIPCTTTDFTIKLYKEDLGTGYSLVVVYLLEYELENEEEDIEFIYLECLAKAPKQRLPNI